MCLEVYLCMMEFFCAHSAMFAYLTVCVWASVFGSILSMGVYAFPCVFDEMCEYMHIFRVLKMLDIVRVCVCVCPIKPEYVNLRLSD